ncbi:hypothetical protein FACS189483_08130 [Spirochaetia bacterium]|nr:hypothetical protein FACS189483_08130 [Spirochaetia bacterium]
MKTTKKGFLFGLVGIALAMGLVLAACELGDYVYTSDTLEIIITLQSFNRYELKQIIINGATRITKGMYTLSGTEISFKPEKGSEYKGTLKDGKLFILGVIHTKRSVVGDAVLSVGDVIDVEFADDFDHEALIAE